MIAGQRWGLVSAGSRTFHTSPVTKVAPIDKGSQLILTKGKFNRMQYSPAHQGKDIKEEEFRGLKMATYQPGENNILFFLGGG